MFYPGAAVVLFSQVAAPAITLADRRYDVRIRHLPKWKLD
jgi:hypothetical protein